MQNTNETIRRRVIRALVLGIAIFFPHAIMAQAGAAYTQQFVLPNGGGPAANDPVWICPYTSSGTPCSPTASVYSNSGLTGSPITQPTSTNQYGFLTGIWMSPGSYIAQVQINATTYYTIQFSVSNSAGGGVNTGTAGQVAYYASTGSVVSGTNALPNGTTATTQTVGDNTTKVATDAFVYNATAGGPFLPLSGGTLTGPLSGTSATFSGTVAAGTTTPTILSANGVEFPNSTIQNTASPGVDVSTPRPTSSNSTGSPQAQVVIALLGNSLVAADTGNLSQLCSEAGSAGGSNQAPWFVRGVQCRLSTYMSVDSSNNVTLTIPNADGYFSVGQRISAYGGGSIDSGCLYVNYQLSAVTSTSITFPTNTPTWIGQYNSCAPMANTAAGVLVSSTVARFGSNGATLDSWYTQTGPTGYSGYVAWMQSEIAAGNFPVTIWTDAGIMTNSTRTSGVDYQQWMSDLEPKIAAQQAATATLPGGQTVTFSQFPTFITTGNPNACQTTNNGTGSGLCSGGSNTGSGGTYAPPQQITGGVQYVYPYGTTGSTYATPATITSGSISAGTNTVTINPCPPDLWGGPGYVMPTTVDSNGNLRDNGNLIQMVLDSSGSGVQELVNVQAVNPTGLVGLNGFQTCKITFANSFSHSANAPIYSTEFTADQTWTDWKVKIAQDIAAIWPTVHVIDSLSQFGQQVANPGAYLANELHPNANGYAKLTQIYLNYIASYFSVPKTPRVPDPIVTDEYNTLLMKPRQDALDLNFSYIASNSAKNLSSGSVDSGAFYSEFALDPRFFYPKVIGGSGGVSSGSAYMTLPLAVGQNISGDIQTGDVLYSAASGSFMPAAVSGVSVFAASDERLFVTGSPNVTYGGRMMVMSPYYVDTNIGSYFSAHPMSYPLSGTYDVTIGSTSTTNSLVLVMAQQQNPSVIGGEGMNCAQISVQQNDWLIISGNTPGTYGTAGTKIHLGSGTWNPGTCTWSDTSGTNYGTYSGYLANLIQEYRAPDASFSTETAQISQPAASEPLGIVVNPTPPISAGVYQRYTTNTTGGNCATGTTYTWGMAYEPISPLTNYGANFAYAGAITTAVTTWNPASGTTNIIGINTTKAPPYRFEEVFYLLIGGTYYAVGATPTGGQVTTTCPSSGAGLTPANTTDQGPVVSFPVLTLGNGHGFTRHTEVSASLTPSAVAANTCAAQSFTVTGLTTGDFLRIIPPAIVAHVSVAEALVTGANTVSINFCGDATGGTPAAGTWTFDVEQ